MKRRLLVALIAVILVSCGTASKINDTTQENFSAKPITFEEGLKYTAAYQADRAMQRSHKKGMMIPAGAMKAILETGIDEINILYGKMPEYKTPVYVVYGSTTNNKPRGATAADQADRVVYVVYYPCPSNCGQ